LGLPLLTKARSPFQVYKGDNYKRLTTLDDEAVSLGTHICDHVLVSCALGKYKDHC